MEWMELAIISPLNSFVALSRQQL